MRRLANRRVGSVSQMISLCSVVSVILGRFRSGFRSATCLFPLLPVLTDFLK
jgi:hypothetical protein